MCSDAASYDIALHRLCSRELARLAIKGTLQERNGDLPTVNSDVAALTVPSSPVMEVLVSVLIKQGSVQRKPIDTRVKTKREDSSPTTRYVNLSVDTLATIRTGHTGDVSAAVSQRPQEGWLSLINGLAMCCLSSKLDASKRQWAVTELTRVLSNRSQKTLSSKDLRDAYHSQFLVFCNLFGW